MTELLQSVVGGITIGAVYALVGMGFVVIYVATKSLNFALGQVMMISALLGLFLHVSMGVPYALTFAIVVVAGGCIGLVIEQITYRPLRNAPATTIILATAACGTIIQSIVQIWDGQLLAYFPAAVSATPIKVHLGIALLFIAPSQIFIVGVLIFIAALLWFLIQGTKFGLATRAVAENRQAASLMGINTTAISVLAWVLGGVFAGLAGLLVAPLVLVTPSMGMLANMAFVGAVLGGFESVAAAAAGGVVLGIVETLLGTYAVGSQYADVVVFGLFVAVLLFRPTGLFVRSRAVRV